MKGQVNIWSLDSDPCPGVWVVHPNDIDDFKVLREYFEHFPIVIMKNDNKECSNLAQVYLSMKHFKVPDLVTNEVRASDEFNIISIALAAIDAFQSFEKEKLLDCLQSVEKLAGGMHRYDRIIFFLEVLSVICRNMDETFFSSIYGYLTRYCWWLEIPDFSGRLHVFFKETNRLPPPFREQLTNVFDELQKIINHCSKRSVEKTFVVISAYCFSLSGFFLKKKLFSYAYLLVHRSLDLYFLAIAVRLGLVLVKRDFLLYHDQNPTTAKKNNAAITLMTTYFRYISHVQKMSSSEEDIVKKINKKRNSLLLTHGVESVDEIDTKNSYLGARNIMKLDQEWFESLEKFKLKIKIDPLLFMRELLGVDHFMEELN